MASLKQEGVIVGAGSISLGLLVFMTEKLADLAVGVMSSGQITVSNILISILLLTLIYLPLLAVQSCWTIFKRVTGLSRLNHLQARVFEMREDIFRTWNSIKKNRERFHDEIASACNTVSNLQVSDRNFLQKRFSAKNKISSLKETYDENIATLENLVFKLFQDIDAAQEIFDNSKKDAREDASQFYED